MRVEKVLIEVYTHIFATPTKSFRSMYTHFAPHGTGFNNKIHFGMVHGLLQTKSKGYACRTCCKWQNQNNRRNSQGDQNFQKYGDFTIGIQGSLEKNRDFVFIRRWSD